MAVSRAGHALLASLMLVASATAADSDYDYPGEHRSLYSDPTADLPDIMLSESVVYVTEGNYFYYTVSLTHQPGMREDKTIDLTNDEVRIYLTSSQEIYQQDDVDSSNNNFVQKIGHRSQLIINTGVDSVTSSNDNLRTGAAAQLADLSSMQTNFPTPYVYVAYSTLSPTQASSITGAGASAKYSILCPKCTHKAYCIQDIVSSGAITGTTTAADAATNVAAFDGCLKVKTVYYAPILDLCTTTPAQYVSATNKPIACTDSVANIGDGMKVDGFDGFKRLITPTPLGSDLC